MISLCLLNEVRERVYRRDEGNLMHSEGSK